MSAFKSSHLCYRLLLSADCALKIVSLVSLLELVVRFFLHHPDEFLVLRDHGAAPLVSLDVLVVLRNVLALLLLFQCLLRLQLGLLSQHRSQNSRVLSFANQTQTLLASHLLVLLVRLLRVLQQALRAHLLAALTRVALHLLLDTLAP